MLTCIGDKAPFHYKKSRRGDAEIDRAVAHVLSHLTEAPEILEFSPYGYDERQYCSPGFNLRRGLPNEKCLGQFSRISYFCRQPEFHRAAVSRRIASRLRRYP